MGDAITQSLIQSVKDRRSCLFFFGERITFTYKRLDCNTSSPSSGTVTMALSFPDSSPVRNITFFMPSPVLTCIVTSHALSNWSPVNGSSTSSTAGLTESRPVSHKWSHETHNTDSVVSKRCCYCFFLSCPVLLPSTRLFACLLALDNGCFTIKSFSKRLFLCHEAWQKGACECEGKREQYLLNQSVFCFQSHYDCINSLMDMWYQRLSINASFFLTLFLSLSAAIKKVKKRKKAGDDHLWCPVFCVVCKVLLLLSFLWRDVFLWNSNTGFSHRLSILYYKHDRVS